MIDEMKVLDHGHVRLVSCMGGDLSVVRSARVSYNAEWRARENESGDIKLIHYLIKNGHTSPFESVVFTFDIKAPIFVFRQWHRHRTWSYNEVSARYAELPEEFYIPRPEHIGVQSTDNKQARNLSEGDRADHAWDIGNYVASCRGAFNTYRDHLAHGWPRELARMVLPLSTYSHMFATVDLHNLFHFLKLRLHPHAQYEIRLYAYALLHIIGFQVPVATEAFKKYVLAKENQNDGK